MFLFNVTQSRDLHSDSARKQNQHSGPRTDIEIYHNAYWEQAGTYASELEQSFEFFKSLINPPRDQAKKTQN